MPEVLLVKTSSMGDVLHNLPVVSDILQHHPGTKLDWVVEEAFAALPALHPGVREVIPVAIRRWRKSFAAARPEMKAFRNHLSARHYDLVLDTQGLFKSAVIARFARAPHCGYDWSSAREPLASLFYERKFSVPKQLHAVERNRRLAGLALGYTPQGEPNYGIVAPPLTLPWLHTEPYVALLHATSRDDKLWNEANWVALGHRLYAAGLRSILPWGSDTERQRAERLAQAIPGAFCAPRLNLREAAALLGNARAAIGVDTGLAHLAAALNVPTIGIYTATDPGLTGLYAGVNAHNLGSSGKPPSVEEVVAILNHAGLHV